MKLGTLEWVPAGERPGLLAVPVARAIADMTEEIAVAPIDPALADTAAFCERYGVGLEESANCVIVAAKRGGETRYAAVMVLATTRADLNGVIRRHLDARKTSFAPQADAVEMTGMEFGGITPIGLPDGWPVLVDAAVARQPYVVIGSGIRGSKLALAGESLSRLRAAEVLSLAQ
ncbi:YbaK/EbsC family protein [Sphaerisporangium corydalis]|uniref:YbaK/EbsC family protein n=1 Tax=Sphaerisporangium corydalis TaxID=1441875 RepID=A0ABV9EJ46_9ACTN|nr:YbaK/EbsC family protein [Sphaerisporangium corydalis]